MGSFDIFCAVCSGSLKGVQIGSTNPRSLRRRHRHVNRWLRRYEAGIRHVSYEVEQQESEDEQSEKSGDEEGDDDEVENDEDYEYSYDPELVDEESVEWLDCFGCLGFNAETRRAFVSGPASYDDCSTIEAKKGDDPNYPGDGDLSLNAYHNFHDGSFPIHWSCFDILTRALIGDANDSDLDKEALYDAMFKLSGDKRLCLDYGTISGPEQFWESVPGEEFSASDPTEVPDFDELLNPTTASEFLIPSANLSLEQKVAADPFDKFPQEILNLIFPYLPGESILALRRASWRVYGATRPNIFWKQLIYREMPWFWELHEVIEENKYPDLDLRSLYLWLDERTTPRYGLTGPFLGVANRRRIWGPCEEIAKQYHHQLQESEGSAAAAE
ncbi:hypothetical protein FQN54_007612 [Arachnomyces sp. PD_36]|nr:hypothetical protein FQN54_007612 [Arachnomyces sp. PD_36]